MTASQQAKSSGLKSLAEASIICNKSTNTLRYWHKNNYELFRAVIAGCVVIKGLTETEYLLQGENGKRLMESIEQLNGDNND